MHQHKWSLQFVKNAFEATDTLSFQNRPMFEMVEYAYLLCPSCAGVKKERIEQPEAEK